MWFASTNRKSLLDLIGGIDPYLALNVKSSNSIKSDFIGNEELLLIWHNKPTVISSLPEMIWVKSQKVDDFLAWTSTYLSGLQPFTAFCRVLDCDVVNEILLRKKTKSFEKIQGACVGVVIGESVTLNGNRDLNAITPTSILSTYSFAMARAFALGIVPENNDTITMRWLNARKLTKQSTRVLGAEKMQDVWAVLRLLGMGKLTKKNKMKYTEDILTVFDSCCELARTNSISAKTWGKLTNNIVSHVEFDTQMKGAIEKRVLWFEKCSNAIQKEYRNKQTIGAFLCAFLVSQIAPGSMKYIELLRPLLRDFPSVIVWYGLCAGISSKTMVYDYERGLGRRILRDLQHCDPIYGKPMCDVSLDELRVLSRSELPNMQIRSISHMHLMVEIAPGIMTAVAWPPHLNNEQFVKKEKKIDTIDTCEDPLNQLGQLLNKATAIHSDLIKTRKDNQPVVKKSGRKKNSKVQRSRPSEPGLFKTNKA